ncbi:putative pentatricopeptide repeat-containing protein At1g64310 [Ziziphus jujuba]|uniref:Pentatricopeptide repeat-containing protein At1g64310 n=1 Tax=Ziziphus jujuba TaxID=326968 RepID=A0A6P4A321_ZIZJJ|nr:putative pentatricopeptide repeat-containing protein At1g64310 [Ziziphus jujuba]XP_015882441.2 putative pentatricopeptide repeat-containing protein At1g64310 [Ziziphus jujuba]
MLFQFQLLHSELSKVYQSLSITQQLHGLIAKTHLSLDPFYATRILRFYAINGDLYAARNLFDTSPNPSVYLWNSVIRAHAQVHKFGDAFSLFRKMLRTETKPDNFIYACIIRACSERLDLDGLKLSHGAVMLSGLGLDSICSSALVTAYSKLALVDEASRVFNGTPKPDLVMWNSMISAYGNCGFCYKGLELFSKMQSMGAKPDGYTLVGLLSGLAESCLLNIGQGLHGYCLKSNLDSNAHVRSVLVSMYSRCESMNSAYEVFYGLIQPDLVTWSALITGYSQSGDYESTFSFFKKFSLEGKKADSVLIASLLVAAAQMANVGPGKEIHAYCLRHGLESDVMVCSALIDMYMKCGFVGLGNSVFSIMPKRNIVSYNSLILGFGLHGLAFQAFKKFEEILETGLLPDDSTFSALLCTCSHAGLVKDGRSIFKRMTDEFCIQPRAEHYVHMVKLLGMDGKLEEAYSLVLSLPEPVDSGIWGALLSCCDACGNPKMAESVAQRLIGNNPESCSYRVMLSNIYAGYGKWDDVGKLRDDLTGGKLRKMPGLSWIEGINTL